MKLIIKRSTSLFLSAILILSGTLGFISSAAAQEASSTAATTTQQRNRWGWFSQEQSGSYWGGQDEQWIYQWRGNNDATRAAVSALGNDIVTELPIPILFGVSKANITPNFGDPRSGGRTHEGLDIMALKGTPIISPTKAVILSKGTGSSSGNYVYTANPGGETFAYMHLNTVSPRNVGDVLNPGDLIGYIGNTGDALGGPDHLHFEVRKNGATDPYPRITKEFTLAEKMTFTQNVLNQSEDRTSLANFLATTYLKEFLNARSSGLTLPSDISDAISRLSTSVATTIGTLELTVGSQGQSVKDLQNFLIFQNKGPAAQALLDASATGYFGAITRAALMEYQSSVGLGATGKYDLATRNIVEGKSLPTPSLPPSTPAVSTSTPVVTPGTVSLIPSFDLDIGSTGKEVVWLQTFLINSNSGPKALVLKEATATGYFGAKTQAALAEYQAKVGLSPAVGYFGPKTRAYITTTLGVQ